MAHSLIATVRSVRRKARVLALVRGLSLAVAAVVALGLCFGLIDFALRIQDVGLRVMMTLLVCSAGLYAFWRFVVLPLRGRLRDVDVAQKIERRFPQLGDRLSSSVEFLAQAENDPHAGSAALRRAVINETEIEVEPLDASAVLDRRPSAKSALLAAVVCAAAGVIVLLSPQLARIGLSRLANPLGSASWPREHHLVLKNPPAQLALGQPFEVEVADERGNLPAEVRIHYRYLVDGEISDESEAMQRIGDLMVARKDRVTRPFEYRAEGGDDDAMPWRRLEVVEPPRVEEFQVELQPPGYTGFPEVESEKRIRALVGTRVAFRGVSTKPLKSAAVEFAGQTYAGRVAEDGYEFVIDGPDLLVKESGDYVFALTDIEELAGGGDERWDVRAVPDSPPTVSIESPATNIFVTPEAIVDLRVLVKDNLRVKSVELRYTRSDQSEEGEQVLPLFAGPDEPTRVEETAITASAELGESRVVEHAWRLAPLGLKPGAQIMAIAVAADYLPQEGQSPAARRITIITETELEDRLAQRQAIILGELARALKMQREARTQTTSLEIQMQEVGHLEKPDIDHLQAAQLNQQQVTRTLTSRTEGIAGQIEGLLADLKSNRMEDGEIGRRMGSFLAEIDRLGEEPLPVIARELTTALKTAEAARKDAGEEASRRVSASLSEAGGKQDHVIESLERLLGDLSQWADYRRFAREVREIRRDQQDLKDAAAEVGKRTLHKPREDLDSQDQADLRKLSQQQIELAQRFEKLAQGMQRMAGELAEGEPLAAATLDDALHEVREAGVSGKMRDSSGALEANKIGSAVESQEQVGKALQAVEDILANRREQQLDRLVKKLRQAEEELRGLREQQRGLRKKLEEEAKKPDSPERRRELQRLTREQKQLQEEIDRLARKLKRLQADRAGRSAERGASALGQSSDSAAGGDAEAAGEQARQAEKDLEEAQQQLAEARRQAEADLAQETLARFEDALRGMIEQQQNILDETQRIDGLNQAGDLSRGQLQSLTAAARQQAALRDETVDYGEKLGKSSVFRFGLEGAARDMQRAAELLDASRTDEDVQRHEQNALARLGQILQALADDGGEEKDADGGPSGGDGGGGGQNLRDLAELRLIKLLQEDINRRTEELAGQVAGREVIDEDIEQFAELKSDQGTLADMVMDLVRADDAAALDDPEKLPDIGGDEASEDETPAEKIPADEIPEFDLELE